METVKNIQKLTKDNADKAILVRNIQNPEWGTFAFSYHTEPLISGRLASCVGKGPHSRIVWDSELHFWEVVESK